MGDEGRPGVALIRGSREEVQDGGVAVLQSAAEAAGAEVEEEVVALKGWIAEQIDPGGRDSRNRLFQRRSVNRGLANKDGRNWRIPGRKLHPLKLSHLHRAIDHLVIVGRSKLPAAGRVQRA